MALFGKKKEPDHTGLVEKKTTLGVGAGPFRYESERTYRVPEAPPREGTDPPEGFAEEKPAVVPPSRPNYEVKQVIRQEIRPEVHVHLPDVMSDRVSKAKPEATNSREATPPEAPREVAKARRRRKAPYHEPPSPDHYPACEHRVYRVRPGQWAVVGLRVKKGHEVVGELRGRTNEWYDYGFTDAKGERDLSNGLDPKVWCRNEARFRAYAVKCPVPGILGGPWYLVIDGRRIRNERRVEVILWAGLDPSRKSIVKLRKIEPIARTFTLDLKPTDGGQILRDEGASPRGGGTGGQSP